MGKYDNLMKMEKRVLQSMAQAHNNEEVITWYVRRLHGSGGCLVAPGSRASTEVPDVPDDASFYEGLHKKGFIVLARSGRDDLIISIQQLALDYAEYARKTPLGRQLADFRYNLIEQKTLSAKLIWLAVGYVLGILSPVLARLIGVGN